MLPLTKKLLLETYNTRLVQRILGDLQSHRVLWNYVYLLFYGWICSYLAIKQGGICGNTIVVTTGGIVTAVFSNYVWSSFLEKRTMVSKPAQVIEYPIISKVEASSERED